MIDSKTGERILVCVDEIYGPYIRVSTFQDGGALEEVLDERFFVLYWKGVPDDLKDLGGNEYFFGGAADPVKLQKIIDSIEFGINGDGVV
ncbi:MULTISPECIES: hypothetical protein [unclassified Pseudomonas]|uniref:hypothetical protein n=1 Tax=unclassified Pseudomonas TaxID=196821 RepID=UPI00200EEE66|nr:MULTISPECIES: hypothetical protein [unclassified Pseudomonas]